MISSSWEIPSENAGMRIMPSALVRVVIEPAVLRYPRTDCTEKEKFVRQFLDLQKEIKNNRWVCDAPSGKEYHDDYCDSVALCMDAIDSAMPPIGEWNF